MAVMFFTGLYTLYLFHSVTGMVNPGPPFSGQPTIPSVPGMKHSQPSISTVTTATQPIMPQQVTQNHQQQVTTLSATQQQQTAPQQPPTSNQPTAPSVQTTMVSHNQDKPQTIWFSCNGSNCSSS